MMHNLIRTGIVAIGSIGVGMMFERHFRLYADVKPQQQLTLQNHGDVVDSPMFYDSKRLEPSSQVSQISKFGFPSMDSLRSYRNFILSYDRRNRVANWVLEYVTPEHITNKDYDRSGIEFREDVTFHQFFRSTNQDYKRSGYDRGHLAAAGNYKSNTDHIKETFVLSNIAPQIGKGFNRDKWNDLEKYCRKKVIEMNGCWICTGPLYLPKKNPSNGKLHVQYEVIGQNHVAVPTHFFKVLLYRMNNGQYSMECFVLPNQPIDDRTSLSSFKVHPELIERSAGILLFNHLARDKLQINP